MPRKRYEEEIEEILENMDPADDSGPGDRARDDGSEAADDAPKEGQLVSWDEVPEKPKRRRPSGRGRRRSGGSGGASPFVITPTRLVVGAVIVVVIVLATSYWPLLILALILFGVAYALNKRKGGPGLMSAGTTRRQKYWRDSPIDFDDEDPDDRGGGGPGPGPGAGGGGWRGG